MRARVQPTAASTPNSARRSIMAIAIVLITTTAPSSSESTAMIIAALLTRRLLVSTRESSPGAPRANRPRQVSLHGALDVGLAIARIDQHDDDADLAGRLESRCERGSESTMPPSSSEMPER